jgi:hypothetical protein
LAFFFGEGEEGFSGEDMNEIELLSHQSQSRAFVMAGMNSEV